jgi:hypothetical protein
MAYSIIQRPHDQPTAIRLQHFSTFERCIDFFSETGFLGMMMKKLGKGQRALVPHVKNYNFTQSGTKLVEEGSGNPN